MNITKLKGKWNVSHGKIKQHTGFLINNAVLYEEGRKQEMYGKFQLKMSRKKVKFTVL